LKTCHAIFLVILLNHISFSQDDFSDIQTFIDSNITRNFSGTYFDNGANSARLVSKFNYFKIHRRFFANFKNYYSSSVTKLNNFLYRDFDYLKLTAGYSVIPGLRISANYRGQFFSDDRSIRLKGSTTNNIYFGADYENNISGADIYSFVNTGYKSENQSEEFDRGYELNAGFNVYNFIIFDFSTDAEMKAAYQKTDPRKKAETLARIYLQRAFDNDRAYNELEGLYSRKKKDYYFPADVNTQIQFGIRNNIETRTENVVSFFEQFDYRLTDNLSVTLTLQPRFRRVTKEIRYIHTLSTQQPTLYDTDIQDVSLSGDLTLKINLGKFNVHMKAVYRERAENHFLINPEKITQNFVNTIREKESTKNNQQSFFQLNSSLYYNLSLLNRLEFTGSTSIFRYDTPSRQNYEDRDELSYNFYLAHRFNNLRNFILVSSLDLMLYHTVYLFSQRSSNNNWNRVIRFTSRSYFAPSDNFRNTGIFSVLANYTVYDFEDIISTVKSYVFRQINLKDSLIIKLPFNIGVDVYGEIKFYERGELNWGNYSQRPVNFFEDIIYSPRLNYFINRFITLSAGYKFFEQKSYKYVNGERKFDYYVRNFGPVGIFRIEWQNNSRLEVITGYDYYRYSNTSQKSEHLNIIINALWNF
jgi:hypothetical protein